MFLDLRRKQKFSQEPAVRVLFLCGNIEIGQNYLSFALTEVGDGCEFLWTVSQRCWPLRAKELFPKQKRQWRLPNQGDGGRRAGLMAASVTAITCCDMSVAVRGSSATTVTDHDLLKKPPRNIRMPGPCNSKKKRKNQTKKEKRVKAVRVPSEPPPPPVESRPSSPLASLSRSYSPLSEVEPNERYKPIRSQPLRFNDNSLTTTRPIRSPASKPPRPERVEYEPQKHTFDALLQRPCVEDLGNGPHVNDISAFLDSRICAPPSLEDPLSAEFAQQEVLEMLCKILPEETAMVRAYLFLLLMILVINDLATCPASGQIMWYNKSRLKSRVCPACKRLYHLGDNTKEPLVDAFDDESLFGTREMEKDQPRRKQSEQRISGICTSMFPSTFPAQPTCIS